MPPPPSQYTEFLSGFRAPILTGAIALVVTIFATPLVKKLAFKYGAVDDPKQDDRRVHKEPIPRWGGIAIYAGILISLLIMIPLAMPQTLFPRYLIGILAVGGLLVIFGALDDLYAFSAKIQLAGLLGAGLIIQFMFDKFGRVQIEGVEWPMFVGGHWIQFPAWLAVILTMIYIFVVSKTMDTIDGIDGLASGIAFVAAAALVVIAASKGEQPRVALAAAAIAGASLGFLRHNYNPAKIFMGTGGAQVLGFSLACLSIVGAFKTMATFALLIPMVFGVPLFDAFFVIVRRLKSGQPITQADKRHVHHTLMSTGLNQKQTVWVLYGAAFLLSAVLVMLMFWRG